MKPWERKAHQIIYAECQREYLAANRLPNGRMRVKHRPYTVPELAEQLRLCLKNGLEEQAKMIFLRLALPPLTA